MHSKTVRRHKPEGVRWPRVPSLRWSREAMVANDRVGVWRVEAWLAGLEVERIEYIVYELRVLKATRLLTSEQKEAVDADLARALSYLDMYRHKRKMALTKCKYRPKCPV